ncbi:TetR/AcrR family transcriptional regulator [Seohaeicola nanhaiensis]|uniref:TetR/AcrR family transcriptional regulator n=1 Tax=Seohaeicola nanhaiensis TaxID=1387282 RepID=A0ABV9KLP4_9RHOB
MTLEKTTAKRGRPSAKQRVLDIALELFAEKGASGLTYDELSKATGLSKGGLIYHFPSKERLIDDVRRQLSARYREAWQEVYDQLPESSNRALKSYALASLENRSNSDHISARMMVSGLWDVTSGRQYYRERFDSIEQGVGFERAALVHLATEGLWFMELIGFSPFSPEERARIVGMIKRIIDGGDLEWPPDEPAGKT